MSGSGHDGKRKDDHDFQLRRMALIAHAKDRTHERDCALEEARQRRRMMVSLAAILAALIVWVIYLGEAAIALEISKCISLLLAGGVGGYGLARANRERFVVVEPAESADAVTCRD